MLVGALSPAVGHRREPWCFSSKAFQDCAVKRFRSRVALAVKRFRKDFKSRGPIGEPVLSEARTGWNWFSSLLYGTRLHLGQRGATQKSWSAPTFCMGRDCLWESKEQHREWNRAHIRDFKFLDKVESQTSNFFKRSVLVHFTWNFFKNQ